MIAVASAFLLSCNMGSKSSEAATSGEVATEAEVKAEADFQRVTDMCRDYLKHPDGGEHARVLQEEREILRVKMLALSDLLAVFRSV